MAVVEEPTAAVKNITVIMSYNVMVTRLCDNGDILLYITGNDWKHMYIGDQCAQEQIQNNSRFFVNPYYLTYDWYQTQL